MVTTSVTAPKQQAAPASQADPPGNFGRGPILIRPGDSYQVHPVAQLFRRLPEHVKELDASLNEHGQRNDIVVRRLEGGDIEILDGSTRCELLHAMGTPVRAREISAPELNGRSVADWIIRTNLAGSEGRDLNDNQRALQIVEVQAEEIAAYRAEAAKRSKAGKLLAPGEKQEPMTKRLARIANVSESCMEQMLQLLSNETVTRELKDAVWDGRVAISTALKVLQLEDPKDRRDALQAATTGDKLSLKRVLAKAKPNRNFQMNIPASLAPHFENSLRVEKAIKLIGKAKDELSDAAAHAKHIDSLSDLVINLRREEAYSLCDWCDHTGSDGKGNPCPTCRGKRFLTVAEFEAAKEREKQKLPHA